MNVNSTASSSGTPEARLAQFMQQHYNLLYDYGLKLTRGDEETTKDCIQETFLAFWNRRHEWSTIESIRAYLLVSLRHRLIDYQRRNKRFVPTIFWSDSEESALQPDFVFSPEDFLIEETTRLHRSQQLADALNRLPRRQREAVFLRYFQELDYADIARIMDIRERTVYNLVHEGLNTLRQQLPPEWLNRLAALYLGAVFF